MWRTLSGWSIRSAESNDGFWTGGILGMGKGSSGFFGWV